MTAIPDVPAPPPPTPNWIGYAHPTGINYDGDTVKLYTEVKDIRLLGVDTPERNSGDPLERTAGMLARLFVRDWLDSADPGRDGLGLIINVKDKGKYGRNLTRIWRRDTGAELGRDLLAAGLARIYWGKRRKPWPKSDLEAMLTWSEVYHAVQRNKK